MHGSIKTLCWVLQMATELADISKLCLITRNLLTTVDMDIREEDSASLLSDFANIQWTKQNINQSIQSSLDLIGSIRPVRLDVGRRPYLTRSKLRKLLLRLALSRAPSLKIEVAQEGRNVTE